LCRTRHDARADGRAGGDLDRKSGDEIPNPLQKLNREHGKTIVMVTHDPHASARATRTVYLNKGQLSAEKPE